MIMNIAIGPIPFISGTRNHILDIVKYSKNNINIIEYSPYSFYSHRGSGFLLKHKIPFIDPYGYYLAKKVLPNYDVVHTHGHPYWWDLYKKPKKSKAKYVHTVHQIYYKEDYDIKAWPWLNVSNERLFQYCKQAEIVISVSKWLQQELKKQDIDSVYIPNGIDIDMCEKANASQFRNKYKIDDDFFLFVGSMDKLKGADLFIELANKINDKLFIMVGTGTSNLELKKNGVILPKNIIGLGRLAHQEVLDAFKACKVFIKPSSKESFGIALIEAMGCKKPVIATNSTGMKEIISDSKFGYLFEQGDIDDLYEKALKAWCNPELGVRGYEEIKKNYAWKNIIYHIDKLYEGV